VNNGSFVWCSIRHRLARTGITRLILYGPKRDEVTAEWRRLHNEELNDLYSLPNIVRVVKIETNEMGRACSTYGGG